MGHRQLLSLALLKHLHTSAVMQRVGKFNMLGSCSLYPFPSPSLPVCAVLLLAYSVCCLPAAHRGVVTFIGDDVCNNSWFAAACSPARLVCPCSWLRSRSATERPPRLLLSVTGVSERCSTRRLRRRGSARSRPSSSELGWGPLRPGSCPGAVASA